MPLTLAELHLIKAQLDKVPGCNDPDCKVCPNKQEALWLINREIKLKDPNLLKG